MINTRLYFMCNDESVFLGDYERIPHELASDEDPPSLPPSHIPPPPLAPSLSHSAIFPPCNIAGEGVLRFEGVNYASKGRELAAVLVQNIRRWLCGLVVGLMSRRVSYWNRNQKGQERSPFFDY